MEIENCPLCGNEVEFRRDGHTQGLFCKNCDWSVVTSYFPELNLDQTTYTIEISGNNHKSQKQIKAVAKVLGSNFLKARKVLQQKQPSIFKGKAPEILGVRKILTSAGLKCIVTPVFKY